MSTWQTDWHAFVLAVAKEANTGKRGHELSLGFEGATIEWIGRVAETRDLNAEIAPSVRMNMPLVIVPLGKRGMVAEHLALPVRATERSSWEGITKGKTICFTARIKMNGVFAALDIAPDDEQGRDFLEIGLECARCVRLA
jgi:hypothetical protein